MSLLRAGFRVVPLLFVDCACAKSAKPPDFARATDRASRKALYKKYRLVEKRGTLSVSWKRADGEYSLGQLSQVAEQFPESEDVYDRATTRAMVIGAVAGAGGGLVGYTIGYNLAADSYRRMSSDEQVALYATGGGLIVTAVIMGLLWENPADLFASTYNRALRQELLKRRSGKGTGKRSGQRQRRSSAGSASVAADRPAWVPVAVGPGSARWAF